jgi:hypothetical protein
MKCDIFKMDAGGHSPLRQQSCVQISNVAVSSEGPKCDCSGKALKQLYGKLQTHPLIREGAI